LEAWESHRAVVVELTVEDSVVLAMLHLTGRGSESGVEMDETDTHLFGFRDGKIVSSHSISSPTTAATNAPTHILHRIRSFIVVAEEDRPWS
jgi:ketosteroid isomerase-like protein